MTMTEAELDQLKDGIRPHCSMADFDLLHIAALAMNDENIVWWHTPSPIGDLGFGLYSIEKNTLVRIAPDFSISVARMGDICDYLPIHNQVEIFKYLVQRKYIKI